MIGRPSQKQENMRKSLLLVRNRHLDRGKMYLILTSVLQYRYHHRLEIQVRLPWSTDSITPKAIVSGSNSG